MESFDFKEIKRERREECMEMSDRHKRELIRIETDAWLIKIFRCNSSTIDDAMDPLLGGMNRKDRLRREIYTNDGKVHDPLLLALDLINDTFVDEFCEYGHNRAPDTMKFTHYRPLHQFDIDATRVKSLIEEYFIDANTALNDGCIPSGRIENEDGFAELIKHISI